MYRTRTCGDLRLADEGLVVTLAGWVQKTRKMGGMTFVDIRDRYGITQLVFNQEVDAALCEKANKLGREFVIQVTGTVRERSSKNAHSFLGSRFASIFASLSLRSIRAAFAADAGELRPSTAERALLCFSL